MPIKEETLTVLVWNIEHNGHDNGHDFGGNEDRRRRAYEVLRDHEPNLVLRQELTNAHVDGRRRMWEEANFLNAYPLMAPGTPESPNPTGVMVDTRLWEIKAEYYHSTNGWHPMTNPVLRLKGADMPVSVASFHLCSYDADTRAREARYIAQLGRPGRICLAGGDCNSYPHRTADERVQLPEWDLVQDPAHYESRTIERNGKRVSDTRPDEILAGGKSVLIEAGHHAAAKLGQEGALDPTASLWRQDQGNMRRIDRLYMSPQLAPALLSFEVVADDAVRSVSDHALLKAIFDLSKFRAACTV